MKNILKITNLSHKPFKNIIIFCSIELGISLQFTITSKMFIKNSATLTLLILSLFIIALFSAATLATQLILGYTPFQELGPQNDPIVINSPCTHIYFIEKYSDGKKARIAVSFICVFITLITTILVLLGVIIFICGCGEKSTQS